jgi:hypothetical protein
MYTLDVRNVNWALPAGLALLKSAGQEEDSRVGPVLAARAPVLTIYRKPYERVMFSAARDANPFFHLFEALWMLAGRQDVAFPAHYAAQLQLYSDDNETLNGAYGYRWRGHFGYDQVQLVIDELKKNPASRRCVIAMWDAVDGAGQYRNPGAEAIGFGYEGDLKRALAGGKDVPCNTHIYFRVVNGALDMTVCNRSNDAVWGAYGANAVHFSILQEYVSLMAGIPMGAYYQFANNFHIYRDRSDVVRMTVQNGDLGRDLYATGRATSTSLFRAGQEDDWHADLQAFMGLAPLQPLPDGTFKTDFFRNVVRRMYRSHQLYKGGSLEQLDYAQSFLGGFSEDWLIASSEWLKRRFAARLLKESQQ